MAFRS